jgi:hypothetical protein
MGVACGQGASDASAPGAAPGGEPAAAPPPAEPGGEPATGAKAFGEAGGEKRPDTETGTAAAPATSAAVEAAQPEFKEVTVPSGTALALALTTSVASDTSAVEDRVRAKTTKPVVIDGVTAIPEGAELVGTVTAAQRSGRVKGRASIAFRFSELSAWDSTYDITTARVSRQAAATKGEDAKKIGIGAGAGAVIGAIAGGGKGAAVGAAVGGGAGTGVVMATRGDEVRLGPGAAVRTTLESPLTLRVPVR